MGGGWKRPAILRSALDVYLGDLQARASPAHYRNVRSQLERLVAAVPRVSPLAVIRHRAARLAAGASHRTVNAEVKALATFLRWAVAAGLLPTDPLAAGIRSLPERERDRKKRRRAMTDAEIERFLVASRRLDRGQEHPMTPLWRTLIETGLRWSECTGLRVDDLRGRILYVRPEAAKTGLARAVPIRPDLAALVRRHALPPVLFVSPASGGPWPRWTRHALDLFYATLDAAGIDRVDSLGRSLDIHALRWTAISRLDRLGVRGSVIQRMVGHASPAMTARYTDLGARDLVAELRAKAWR